MKIHNNYIAISVLTLLVSCSSFEPVAKKRVELVQPQADVSVSLEVLVSKQSTARQELGLAQAKTLTEAQATELKEYFKNKKSSAIASEKTPRKKVNVIEHLKKYEFSALNESTLDEVIKASGKLKSETAQAVSKELLGSLFCAPAQVSLAFGAYNESRFPDTLATEQATKLYEKAYSCGTGEIKARAAYRLGLFSLLKKDCDKSQNYWDAVTQVSEVKFLFSRAIYWKNHCNISSQDVSQQNSSEQKTLQRKIAMEFYNNYPLSFHTIQVFKENQDELGAVVMSRANPMVQARTRKDARVNELIQQIEAALEARDYTLAREYYSWLTPWVSDERIEALEPHVRLYLGYLSYAAQDGLDTFQILSKTFAQYPELKSPATLKIFYPKWFYSEIQKAAFENGLDPLLVISLVRQESAFNKEAVSRVGARGLMQLMPRTARGINRKLGKNDLLDAEKNIKAGTTYFAGLMKRYNGNAALALAAYNAGYGAVDKWVTRYPSADPLLFADLIPYRETREYVGSILRNLYWYQALESTLIPPKVIIGDLQLSPKKDI